MSQRTLKVESLIRQTVAPALTEALGRDAAQVTVTRVQVTPDLRHATVWVGLLTDEHEAIMNRLSGLTHRIQAQVSQKLTSKFVPRIELKLDDTGEYVDRLSRLLKKDL